MNDAAVCDCADIKERVKSFLDDMLSEEDYIAFTSHCGQCASCGEYLASFGSLSNDLHALGAAVSVPADFENTAIFKCSNPPPARAKDSPVDAGKLMKRSAAWIAVAVIACAAAYFFIRKGKAQERVPEVVFSMEEAVEDAAEDVAGEISSISGRPVGDIPDAVEKAVPETQLLPKLHMHAGGLDPAGEKKFSATLEALGIIPEFTSRNCLVFSAPGKDAESLRALLQMETGVNYYSQDSQFLPGQTVHVSLEFGDLPRPSAAPAAAGAALVSLEKPDTVSHVHWHIFSILPDKGEELLNRVRAAGGSPIYESREFSVFSLPGSALKGLTEKIGSLEGVSLKEISRADGEAGRVELSLYRVEK